MVTNIRFSRKVGPWGLEISYPILVKRLCLQLVIGIVSLWVFRIVTRLFVGMVIQI